MREDERVLIHAMDRQMKQSWDLVLQNWQKELVIADTRKSTVALVTRDCTECETRVRVGVLISPYYSYRPTGIRAYCAKCKKVTLSPVAEVRGLLVEEEDLDEGE